MKKNIISPFILLCSSLYLLTLFVSCVEEEPVETSDPNTNTYIRSGDILVASTGNRAVILLDSEGNFKSVLFSAAKMQSQAANIGSIAYEKSTGNILVSVYDTLTPDRIWSINTSTGKATTKIQNAATAVTAAGMTALLQLEDGRILTSEAAATFDIYNAAGTLITNGSATPQITGNLNDANPRSAGGLIACSASQTKVYDSSFAQIGATRAGAINGCLEIAPDQYIVSDGAVIRHFNNVTNAVWTGAWSFTNGNYIAAPRGLAVNASGEILVSDITFDHIAVLDADGNFSRIINPGVLSDPTRIVIIP